MKSKVASESSSAQQLVGDSGKPPGSPPEGSDTPRMVEREKDTTHHLLAATFDFGHEFRANDLASSSKQESDLVFASVLLRDGHCTERQLIRSIGNWTIHGVPSLASHLVAEKVLSPKLAEEVESAARQQLGTILSKDPPNTSPQERQKHILAKLDLTGRLARLLGIADSSVLTETETETRCVGSRYTLLRRLGQGGLGTVWLARDENLHRYVAVKELNARGTRSTAALAQLRREAEITGSLEHPGVVPVYQYGLDEATGRAFYAMRFLGKRTLQDAILEYHERREVGSEDRLLMHRLITAFVNLCQAVAHAHSRRVIHRDLKPDNIAVDGFGQVVLLDWGLSKINDATGMYEVNGRTEPGDLHDVGATHLGRVLGTPLYMAPEQAAGRLDEVDELTDVFGLGGVLFAILTGEAPHQRAIEAHEGTQQATQVFSKIVANEVPEPRDIVSTIPPELSAICRKALSNKRYLRYSSASELADDIQHYMAGAPVSAYEAPIGRRITNWMAVHPTMAQLVLLLVSVIFFGGIAIAFTANRGKRALEEAKYNSLRDFARELDVTLQFETEELVHDVRFLTDLPLMQAITVTQRPDSFEDLTIFKEKIGLDLSNADASEWLERQATLQEGLLKANPDYLVATSVTIDQLRMRELVRSERIASGSAPNRVPPMQLFDGELPQRDEFLTLRPGQIALTTGDQLSEEVPTQNRSPLVLVGVCPIFDPSGEFFGMNVIELDLSHRLKDTFRAMNDSQVDVFVTDTNGNIALSFRNGEAQRARRQANVFTQFPDLGSVLGPTASVRQYGDGQSLYAIRVKLGDENSEAELGIVAHIHNAQ